MTDAIRGAAVFIDVIFLNEDGAQLTPASATVRLRYFKRGVLQNLSYALTNTGTTWQYIWDSSVADPGTVYWFATSPDAPKAAAQGDFPLLANVANPAPAV